jgi:hypothetical protein
LAGSRPTNRSSEQESSHRRFHLRDLRLKSPLFSSFVAAGTIGVGEVKVNADDFVVLELVSVLYISVQGSKSILGNNKTNREFKIKKIGLTSYCYFLLLLFHHLRTLVVQIPQVHQIPPAHRYQSLRRGLDLLDMVVVLLLLLPVVEMFGLVPVAHLWASSSDELSSVFVKTARRICLMIS